MPLTAATPKGFCTPDDVAAFLGVTFTPAQVLACNALIARVETFLENECNREWLSGPVLGEVYYAPFGLNPPSFFTSYIAGWVPLGSIILLQTTPVQSVEALYGTGWLDSTPIQLLPNLEYDVRDLSIGYIQVTVPSAYYKITVNYTPKNAVPSDITQACVLQVATWAQPMLNPDSWSLDSLQLPDLTVRWNRTFTQLSILPEVESLIDNYRFRVTA